MTLPLSFIFIIGAVIFALTSLYFAWTGRHKAFNSAVLVTGVTLVSYVVMLEGSLFAVSPGGELVFWTRWVGYAISCSILMYVIASRLRANRQRVAMMLGLTILVMLTGAFASVMSGIMMWLMFIISSGFYIGLIALIYHPQHRVYIGPIAKYIWLGWTLFPVIFILAPDGLGIICAFWAAIGYLILDIFTKIIFYLDLQQAEHATQVHQA